MPYAYRSQHEKVIDFWGGFIGWFVVNGIMIGVLQGLGQAGGLAGALLFGLNIVVPIVLLAIRPPMAYGILLAFANVLALVVVVGIFETAADFIPLPRPAAQGRFFSLPPYGLIGVPVYGVAAFFVMRGIVRRL